MPRSLKDLYRRQRDRVRKAAERARAKGLYVPEDYVPNTPKVITEEDLYNLAIKGGADIRSKQGTWSNINERPASYTRNGNIVITKKPKETSNKIDLKKVESQRLKYYESMATDMLGMGLSTMDETEGILNTIENMIDSWSMSVDSATTKFKEQHKNRLRAMLENAIQTAGNGDEDEGRRIVAENIQNNGEQVIELANTILYMVSGTKGEDTRTRIENDFVRFSTIIMGRALTQEESKAMTAMEEYDEIDNTGL